MKALSATSTPIPQLLHFLRSLLDRQANEKPKQNETELAFSVSPHDCMKGIIAGSYSVVCKQIHMDWKECATLLLLFLNNDDCRLISRGKKITALPGRPLLYENLKYSML